MIFENSPIVHFFILMTSCLYSCCNSQPFRYFCFYFRKGFLHFRIFDFGLNTFQQGKTLLKIQKMFIKNQVIQTEPIKPRVNCQLNVTPTHPSHSITASETKKKKTVFRCLFKLDRLIIKRKNISITKAIRTIKGKYL